jgi:hypothetical protein
MPHPYKTTCKIITQMKRPTNTIKIIEFTLKTKIMEFTLKRSKNERSRMLKIITMGETKRKQWN